MRASTRKTATVPVKPDKNNTADAIEQINSVLIFELDVEPDDDLKPEALLADFPGYDEDWSIAYLTALLEDHFTIELPDDEAMAKAKTVRDVHNIVQKYLPK